MKNYLFILFMLSSPLFIFSQNEWNETATFALATNNLDIGTNDPEGNLYASADMEVGLDQNNKRLISHSRTNANSDFKQTSSNGSYIFQK